MLRSDQIRNQHLLWSPTAQVQSFETSLSLQMWLEHLPWAQHVNVTMLADAVVTAYRQSTCYICCKSQSLLRRGNAAT